MNAVQFIKLFVHHIRLTMGVGLMMAFLIYNSTKDTKPSYSTEGRVNTHIIAGYNPESQGSGNTDLVRVRAEMGNLLTMAESNETYDELSARLIAEIIMEGQPSKLIAPRGYDEFITDLTPELADSLRDTASFEQTLANVQAMRDRGDANPLYELIHSKNDLVSLGQLKTIKITQEGRSDILLLKYSASDAGICQRTLEITIDIIKRRHKENKFGQSSNVVDYFRQATDQSFSRLNGAEGSLKNYMESNNVINYYEQTRFIAEKREDVNQQFDDERMKIAAADSVLRNLEQQMQAKVDLANVNQNILQTRDSLADLSARLMEIQLLQDSGMYRGQVSGLERAYGRLRNSIKEDGRRAYEIQVTPKGAEAEKLLEKWLLNVLSIEESRAKMKIIRERKKSFDEVYASFAPMGSRIKQLEREIGIREEDYLQNLHSLNMAILHQRSLMMSTDLTVVDDPFYPPKADPAQTIILVIVGFLAGFVLTLAVVIGMEYFDSTLKSPTTSAKMTGMEVIGAFPKFPPPVEKKWWMFWKKRSKIQYDKLKEKVTRWMLQSIKSDMNIRGLEYKQITIFLTSNRDKEGKTFVGQILAEKLRSFKINTVLLTPEPQADEEIEPETLMDRSYVHEYAVPPDFFHKQEVKDLFPDQEIDLSTYEFVIVELPALLDNPYPMAMLTRGDYTFMVGRANRTWSAADKTLLEKISEPLIKKPYLIINGVQEDLLEGMIGDIPKKRSRVRRVLKRFVFLGFKSRSKI
ncbi:MAG: hypothetical protein AAFS00_00485 [Bacteroidota bacterium]